MARSRVDRARSVARHVIALDSSCMIALVWGPHEHHAETTVLVEQRLDAGAEIAVAAHALAETYSVLTRLPAPHRTAPEQAVRLLVENFRDPVRTFGLGVRDYWSLLTEAPDRGIHGGRTYDAIIVACARKARARELITLNARHFEGFADERLQITTPLA